MQIFRKLRKKFVKYVIIFLRKIFSKSPKLKASVKRILETQLHALSVTNLTYATWVQENFPDYIDYIELKKEVSNLKYNPLISIVVPCYNTKDVFLHDCIKSVLSQAYENWELCIIDDASPDSKVRKIINEYSQNNNKIKTKFLKNNQHISGATNEGIKLATGEFVSLLDHDDILWPNALLEVAKALNKNKDLDLIYTDEDKITKDRREHLGPFFKPDWNPDFLRSVNYITHFTTIRKSILEDIGGFKSEYNGAQDWDLFLRITNITNKICHVPKIVYSWRIHSKSTAKDSSAKPYVVEAQRKVLEEDAKRNNQKAIVKRDKKHSGYWEVEYLVENNPLISIVIPSKNQYRVLKRCVDSIYKKTTYKNFEIVLVDTGSDQKRVLHLYKKLIKNHDNFKLVNWPEQPFSYSRSCNKGAEESNGELLVMLNNDTEILTSNWLEIMAGDAQRQSIGAVGALLFFPDNYHIQHAGVGVGLGGLAANSFSMMTLDRAMSQTQHLMINTKHNMTAVTAACLMIRKSLFDEIKGFSEEFRVTYNDVDLCLRLYEAGYQNIYNPYVRLIHHESISVGAPSELQKRDSKEFRDAKKLFKTRWKKYIKNDPNINPNLNKDNAFYDIL